MYKVIQNYNNSKENITDQKYFHREKIQNYHLQLQAAYRTCKKCLMSLVSPNLLICQLNKYCTLFPCQSYSQMKTETRNYHTDTVPSTSIFMSYSFFFIGFNACSKIRVGNLPKHRSWEIPVLVLKKVSHRRAIFGRSREFESAAISIRHRGRLLSWVWYYKQPAHIQQNLFYTEYTGESDGIIA